MNSVPVKLLLGGFSIVGFQKSGQILVLPSFPLRYFLSAYLSNSHLSAQAFSNEFLLNWWPCSIVLRCDVHGLSALQIYILSLTGADYWVAAIDLVKAVVLLFVGVVSIQK